MGVFWGGGGAQGQERRGWLMFGFKSVWCRSQSSRFGANFWTSTDARAHNLINDGIFKIRPQSLLFYFYWRRFCNTDKNNKTVPVTNGWSFLYTKDLKVKFIIHSDQTDHPLIGGEFYMEKGDEGIALPLPPNITKLNTRTYLTRKYCTCNKKKIKKLLMLYCTIPIAWADIFNSYNEIRHVNVTKSCFIGWS